MDWEDAARQLLEEFDGSPLLSVVEIGGPLGGPRDEFHSSPLLQTESLLSLSTQPSMPAQVEHVVEVTGNPSVINGVGVRQYTSPSPTPSEHGSDASRLQLQVTDTATNNDTRLPSTVSSVSAGPFSNPRYYLLTMVYMFGRLTPLTALRRIRPAIWSCMFRPIGYPTIAVRH